MAAPHPSHQGQPGISGERRCRDDSQLPAPPGAPAAAPGKGTGAGTPGMDGGHATAGVVFSFFFFFLQVKGKARARFPGQVRERCHGLTKACLKTENPKPEYVRAQTHPEGPAGASLVTARPGSSRNQPFGGERLFQEPTLPGWEQQTCSCRRQQVREGSRSSSPFSCTNPEARPTNSTGPSPNLGLAEDQNHGTMSYTIYTPILKSPERKEQEEGSRSPP